VHLRVDSDTDFSNVESETSIEDDSLALPM
jgi:hypothetical protein